MSGWLGKQAGLFYSVFQTVKVKRHPETFKRAQNPSLFCWKNPHHQHSFCHSDTGIGDQPQGGQC